MGRSPKRQQRNPEVTRKRILEAAQSEFARKGYDGARLRDVAEGAGVHHALLHHYFGDKEGLFRAVVHRAFERISARTVTLLKSSSPTDDVVERYVRTLVDFHAESPELLRLLHFAQLDEGSPAYDACDEVMREMVHPVLELMGKAVERAQRAGEVRSDIDARRIVALSVGAVSLVFQEERFFSGYLGEDVRSDAGREAQTQACVAFLRRAIAPAS